MLQIRIVTSYHHGHTTVTPHPPTPLMRLKREHRAPSHATHRACAAGTAHAALFPHGRVGRDRSAGTIGAGTVSPAGAQRVRHLHHRLAPADLPLMRKRNQGTQWGERVRHKVAHLQPLPPGHGTSQPQVSLHAVARSRPLPRSAMVAKSGEEPLLKGGR